MLKSSQLARPAVIAATVISLGASPAVARQADVPLRPKPAVTAAQDSRQWTQPRVDGAGVRPANQPVDVAPAPPVPLTRASHTSGGADWLLITIGSSAMVALLLAVALARKNRYWAHRFRARQV
jgi:hypothetical protein